MKTFVLCMLLSLLLSGCSREVAVATAAPEISEPTVTEAVRGEETVEASLPEPADSDFVRILDYIPTARQELAYATEGNFTGKVIYPFQDAYLRYGTVKKLMAVSRDLEELGMYLKIWDGFRPVSAQFTLWEACPDSRYVADPNVRFSSHSRGNTVDLTITDAQGKELPMPTAFDDFTEKADRNYEDCTPEQRDHAMILELIMEKHGFAGYKREWWHYTDTDSYPVEELFSP